MVPITPETRPAARQGLAVGFATGLYGLSFGALAGAAGADRGEGGAVAGPAVLGGPPGGVGGGGGFALIGVLASGGSSAAAVAASTLLGLRNGFYGVQIARVLRPRGVTRAVAAQLTIDESTAVALAQADPAQQRVGFWATGGSVYVFWNAMTLAGALLGNALGDPKAGGLDAAASGAFIALLWPRLASRAARRIAAGAAAVALLATPWVPPGVPILLAALVAVLAGGRPDWVAGREAAALQEPGP